MCSRISSVMGGTEPKVSEPYGVERVASWVEALHFVEESSKPVGTERVGLAIVIAVGKT